MQIRKRVEALEGQARPAASAPIDIANLPDADRQFVESLGERCRPDYRQLTVPELRRVVELCERYERAHEPA